MPSSAPPVGRKIARLAVTRTARRPLSTARAQDARGHAARPKVPARHRDPVLVRYYANLKLPYGTGLDTVRRT